MRTEMPSIVGRDHLSYRGYNAACKAVIDGDLCELYARLPVTKQASIAQELDRTHAEVSRKYALRLRERADLAESTLYAGSQSASCVSCC